jgi:peptidoglycan hydrolase-like protein with peptidoglycan-binding domain
VIDNGIGIAEQDLARIGEPFTQVHNDYTRQFDGAGLGLSLVKGLVNLHGGSMAIESAPGQGTTATIGLPVDGPASRKEAEGKIVALGKSNSRSASDGSLRKTAQGGCQAGAFCPARRGRAGSVRRPQPGGGGRFDGVSCFDPLCLRECDLVSAACPYGSAFATRAFETFVDAARRAELAQPQTTIKIERPEETAPPPRLSDPVVEKVQRILSDLGFYAGDVDGIKGPNTSQAVEAYQRKLGLTPSGVIDQELLDQLGANETTGAIIPSPKPQAVSGPEAPAADKKALIGKIQAGLRAFGNQGIEVDGLLGARTKAGIKEFQGLFGLPQTGEPEAAVYAKMKEIKLVD